MPNVITKGKVVVVPVLEVGEGKTGEFIEVCPLPEHVHPVGSFTHEIVEVPQGQDRGEFLKEAFAAVAERHGTPITDVKE